MTYSVTSGNNTSFLLHVPGVQGPAGPIGPQGVPGEITSTGVQSLSNKTLTSPTITSPKINEIDDTNGNTVIGLGAVASAVNNIQVSGSATTAAPSISTVGADTNVSLNLVTKGTASFVTLSPGNVIGLKVVTSASAVNYVQLTGSTGSPLISAVGTSPDINMTFEPKGTGQVFVNTDSGTVTSFRVSGVSSGVNYVQAIGAVTGAPARLAANGTDTNVDLNLTTKGSGVVTANSNPVGVKVAVPATAASTGVLGQWAADASYMYVCTAANTWKRTAVATW